MARMRKLFYLIFSCFIFFNAIYVHYFLYGGLNGSLSILQFFIKLRFFPSPPFFMLIKYIFNNIFLFTYTRFCIYIISKSKNIWLCIKEGNITSSMLTKRDVRSYSSNWNLSSFFDLYLTVRFLSVVTRVREHNLR